MHYKLCAFITPADISKFSYTVASDASKCSKHGGRTSRRRPRSRMRMRAEEAGELYVFFFPGGDGEQRGRPWRVCIMHNPRLTTHPHMMHAHAQRIPRVRVVAMCGGSLRRANCGLLQELSVRLHIQRVGNVSHYTVPCACGNTEIVANNNTGTSLHPVTACSLPCPLLISLSRLPAVLLSKSSASIISAPLGSAKQDKRNYPARTYIRQNVRGEPSSECYRNP